MTTLSFRRTADAVPATRAGASARAGEREGWEPIRYLAPNWFAVVMGTGIIANAAATLPLQFVGLRAAATVVWGLASVILIVLAGAWVLHWRRYPDEARGHGMHPIMMQFYGAVPMALMTVGAGTLMLGKDVIGLTAALTVDWVLWSAGTVFGLLTAASIPYRMITRHSFDPDSAFGGWLMPVVPPMVSAALGALLVPYAPEGQARLTMFVLCLAMFGLSLIAALVTITLIWSRLLHHGLPPVGMVATVWLVLGPLGQGVTASGALANVAPTVFDQDQATGLQVFSMLFGIPAWGFAMLWLVLAIAVTWHARKSMPFNLTWWGFTFPLGCCVTGSTALYQHTGANLFAVTAVTLYALLVAAWAVVAAKTVRGIMVGTLLRPAR
ncbi:TDT family transporter [Nocardia seriolae]|uniref:TDT family transporter n=1 Tax=Nocardia seriolae TaxID=37332 RepID=UPI0009DEDBB0|nr:TDT family transporter [Nocardia seriolae]RLP29398.1 C4-dicarboxylate ABC transporter [Nocardia seriolae]WKY54790.1 TDT family transporter [Nocardia seriolae]BEK89766.1 TDT family transporter [Nocardia seriolae]GEM26670.1 C4-dicarboxylate ABC transporter [Nocardia seriolae NBRC 15557]